MFTALSDFLKDTLSESIKGLLQPANFLTAIIFLVLNLLFVLPSLVDQNISLATQYLSLNASLQIILGITMILILAYLLLSMNKYIFKLMTGDLWNDSPFLAPRLQKSEQKSSLLPTFLDEKDKNLFLKFLDEEENIGSTALGNAIRDTSNEIVKRFGINLTSLWPFMESVIADEKDLSRISTEKAILDFLVNLTFILGLFAIEQVLVQFLWPEGLAVLWAWVSLVLAFIIYRAAVSKAYDWGAMVILVFYRHRGKLQQELGLRQFKDFQEERQVWQKVSIWFHRWIRWKGTDYVPDQVLPDQELTWKVSNNAQVVIQSATIDIKEPESEPYIVQGIVVGFQQVYQCIEYTMFVNNIKADANNSGTDDIYVTVWDPQVPIIDEAPTALDWRATKEYHAQIIPANPTEVQFKIIPTPVRPINRVDQLYWCIDALQSNSSIGLRYTLPSRIFKAVTNKTGLQINVSETVSPDTGAIKYKFIISNNAQAEVNDITLKVLDSRRTVPDPLPGGFKEMQVNSQPGAPTQTQIRQPVTIEPRPSGPYCLIWEIGKLGKQEKIVLQYTV